jgi:hypothetical protein
MAPRGNRELSGEGVLRTDRDQLQGNGEWLTGWSLPSA